jgi:glycosyltransferase involved in cell wall biosynthesis
MQKSTLLFVSTNYSSFVRQDAEMLSRHLNLKRFEFGSRKGAQMILYQFKLLFWLLGNIGSAKGILVWFGDYHSFLPMLIGKGFGKKRFLIIGGYDAAQFKEYGYGGHNSRLRSWMIKKSCNWATVILPVSHFVQTELPKRIGPIRPQSKVIYNGVDLEVFKNRETGTPRNGVLCVSIADSISRVKIKGLDILMELAAKMPEQQFTIVGVTGEAEALLAKQNLPNLVLIGKVKREELETIYCAAKVICQFSRFESFGMALAEGMLCGCIPVTVKGIGAAEVVDPSCGVIAESIQIESLVAATRRALEMDHSHAIRARKHIENEFSLERREVELLATLKEHGLTPTA